MQAQTHSGPAIEMFSASPQSPSTFVTAVAEAPRTLLAWLYQRLVALRTAQADHTLLTKLNERLVARRTAEADRAIQKGLRVPG